ncbi:CHAD domain-containing protein [Mucilaginibacter frigoritolerans]|uniref:CHAD domain-containing protein n=1 Tax=Mucilaginibacter frigoritolerans TaxID=652788 RepID=A0A562TSW8_9SPHI|nr:CHAD domain-containing protein [Mucilaginibacter frigoritolerans]TWI96681.1 CHAD domain-containing protein [Mucilaginibacter frigoritolerans]
MKKKEEIKYLDKEWEEMDASLKLFLETGDQEALHKFRVQIKKIKAILSLIEGSSDEKGLLKQFKPVRKIFKSAGYVRDAHVHLQLSSKYGFENEEFENNQQKIIEEGTIELQNKSKKIISNIKSTRKELKKQLPSVSNESIVQYYKQQLEQIAVNFTVSGFTEDMHTNRKLIKILVYNHKFAGEALNSKLNFNKVYLDKLQEAIGKWHDNVLAAQLFSSPPLNDKPIVIRINRINAGVKRTITSLGNDFMKKATTFENENN